MREIRTRHGSRRYRTVSALDEDRSDPWIR